MHDCDSGISNIIYVVIMPGIDYVFLPIKFITLLYPMPEKSIDYND